MSTRLTTFDQATRRAALARALVASALCAAGTTAIAGCGSNSGSVSGSKSDSRSGSNSAKRWAASECPHVTKAWSRAKSDYDTMMAALNNPAKPIGNLTWTIIGNEFTAAEHALNALREDAPTTSVRRTLSGATGGAQAISTDADLYAGGVIPPTQNFGGSPRAAIKTISSVLTAECG